MAEWFWELDLKPGGPWLESFTLLLSGFVLSVSSPEVNSLTTFCKQHNARIKKFNTLLVPMAI